MTTPALVLDASVKTITGEGDLTLSATGSNITIASGKNLKITGALSNSIPFFNASAQIVTTNADLTWNNSTKLLAVGAGSANSRVLVTTGLLSTTINALKVTATMPATTADEAGAYIDITSAGTTTGSKFGAITQLRAGFTGTGHTFAHSFRNETSGTAFNYAGISDHPFGNISTWCGSYGTTTGQNIGSVGYAANSVAAIGLNGRAFGTTNSIGIAGGAMTGTKQIGGYFNVQNHGDPYSLSSTVIALDNGNNGTPFLSAFIGGTTPVFQVDGVGNLDLKNHQALNSRAENLASNPAGGNIGRVIYNTALDKPRVQTDDGSAFSDVYSRRGNTLFSNLGNSLTVSNTTSPSLFSVNTSVPANTMVPGSAWRVKAGGSWRVPAAGGPYTMTFALRLAASDFTIASFTGIVAGQISGVWTIDVRGNMIASGGNNLLFQSIYSNAWIQGKSPITGVGQEITDISGFITTDKTVAMTIGITVTLGTADPLFQATLKQLTVELNNP